MSRSIDNQSIPEAVVLMTFDTLDKAREVLISLLKQRRVAGGNILPAVETHYIEDDFSIASSTEVLVVCRTTGDSSDRIVHDYKDADFEVSVLQGLQASAKYSSWLTASCTNERTTA